VEEANHYFYFKTSTVDVSERRTAPAALVKTAQ